MAVRIPSRVVQSLYGVCGVCARPLKLIGDGRHVACEDPTHGKMQPVTGKPSPAKVAASWTAADKVEWIKYLPKARRAGKGKRGYYLIDGLQGRYAVACAAHFGKEPKGKQSSWVVAYGVAWNCEAPFWFAPQGTIYGFSKNAPA
jgi:hypothetical protein